MKSLEELAAIRAKMLEQVSLRKGDNIDTRIVVGMATCGIAAGARPVMLEFIEELKRRGIENATVSQTGCVGVCPVMALDMFRLDLQIDVAKCTCCGLCTRACPAGALRIEEEAAK